MRTDTSAVVNKYRRFVSSAGNLWGLDASLNRSAQDEMPAEKFMRIESTRVAGSEQRIWPRDRWWLSDKEIKTFGRVGTMLDQEQIDPAMDLFHQLVTGRARRMVKEVLG